VKLKSAIILYLIPFSIISSLIFCVYPGYLSFDSAFQFWQARGDSYYDIAPPLFPWLWHLLLKLFPGTTGIILVICSLYGIGFGFLAVTLAPKLGTKVALIFSVLAPLCPILVLLIPHLWTDVFLGGALLLAFAMMSNTAFSIWRLVAIMTLCIVAACIRHNSLIALIPLMWFWAGSRFWSSGWLKKRPILNRGILLIVLLLPLWLSGHVVRTVLVKQRLDTWAVTLMFDLQSVSVSTGINRVPKILTGEGMQVQELVGAFNPYSATKLFEATRSGVANPTVGPLEPVQRRALIDSWLSVLSEPSYWQHRLRLFRGLLGTHRGPELAGLSDSPQIVAYKDNPPMAFSNPSAHQGYRALVDSLRTTPAYSAGWYLILAGVLITLRWHRTPGWLRENYVALYGSALIYTLPYFFIAPSAELRYVLWSALASWLCILLCVLAWIWPSTVSIQDEFDQVS
jgi:hypothetical protein